MSVIDRLLRWTWCLTAVVGCSRTTKTEVVAKTIPPEPVWVATWAASPQEGDEAPSTLATQTIRQVVRVSLGGPRLRVRLTNLFGHGPVRLASAHVARHDAGVAIVAGSDRPLSFSGAAQTVLAPGSGVTSDPVAFDLGASSELVVSLTFAGDAPLATGHAFAGRTTYFSGPGDYAAATSFAPQHRSRSWYFLEGVDVEAPQGSFAVVALGDSITDGMGSTLDTDRRWPDELGRRLRASGAPCSVVNAGISGNRVLAELAGPSALDRFEHDVLAQPGARYVVVLEGINDIGAGGAAVTEGALTDAYRVLVRRAHERGLSVIGGTLVPFEGTGFDGFYSVRGEATRQAVNRWIRDARAFDGVIDFDRALRDPDHPSRLAAAFDSGDHLHPSDAGYGAMAGTVDLGLFGKRSAGSAP